MRTCSVTRSRAIDLDALLVEVKYDLFSTNFVAPLNQQRIASADHQPLIAQIGRLEAMHLEISLDHAHVVAGL